MNVISRIVLTSLLAGSGAALAQSAAPSFESLDKNGDGKISVAEAADNDRLFVAFKSLDSDQDGELTREEYAKYK